MTVFAAENVNLVFSYEARVVGSALWVGAEGSDFVPVGLLHGFGHVGLRVDLLLIGQGDSLTSTSRLVLEFATSFRGLLPAW